MTIPVAVIVIAFGVFLVLFLVQSGGFRRHKGQSILGEAQQRSRRVQFDRGEIVRVWVFSLVALVVILLESSATWPLRGAIFGLVVVFLAISTYALSSWGR
jgi:di/tricarboxylate transporter